MSAQAPTLCEAEQVWELWHQLHIGVGPAKAAAALKTQLEQRVKVEQMSADEDQISTAMKSGRACIVKLIDQKQQQK
jgi:hypothetical protein